MINYNKHINSNNWKIIKEKAKSRPHIYGKCHFCNTNKNIELHHKSYNRIGTKNEMKDIIPLCRKHHQQVHDYSNKYNKSILDATNDLSRYFSNNLL